MLIASLAVMQDPSEGPSKRPQSFTLVLVLARFRLWLEFWLQKLRISPLSSENQLPGVLKGHI